MAVLICDGSFDGLMTALHRVFVEGGEGEEIAVSGAYQPDLFSASWHIPTREETSLAMMEAVRRKISPKALQHIYRAWCSGKKDAGTVILRYLKQGFALGKAVDFHHLDPDVAALHSLSKKVGRELHRLLGLTRFRLLESGILYAPLEPEYDILALLAPHFALRLPRENWIIHDIKRGQAALYNQKRWVITDLEREGRLPLSREEEELQDLWKNYFARIAIEERKNPRLQAGNMPKKYWKYLVEKEGKFK